MSETKIKDLRINKGLTKQQLIDSTVITEDELSFVTDDSVVDVPAPTEAGKVLTSTEDGVEWAEGSSGLPDQTGQSGKFLTTNGTDASWSDKPLVNKHTGTSALSICGNDTSSTGNWTVAVGFNSSASYKGVAIGYYAQSHGVQCTAIGYYSSCGGDRSIAIGYTSRVTAQEAYQLGYGTNSERGTFYVGMSPDGGETWKNHKLLDKDGTIPEARLADTTNATAGQVLTLDSNLNAVWAEGGGGLQNTATGTNALTILGTPTNKDYATNIGVGSIASNDGDTAIGYNAEANGGYEYSTAVGYRASAVAAKSVAVGGEAQATANGSVVIGQSATATDSYSISIGLRTGVTGWGAIQLGGYGVTNSEAGTFYVGLTPNNSTDTVNYKLLDSDGTIPVARLTNVISDSSTTATNQTWSASKLNATIGDIETLINAL